MGRNDMADGDGTAPLSGKERAAKHRRRMRERELQVALAAARLALGQDAGDQKRALADFLKKQASQPDIPDDYRETLDEAVDRLSSKRRR